MALLGTDLEHQELPVLPKPTSIKSPSMHEREPLEETLAPTGRHVASTKLSTEEVITQSHSPAPPPPSSSTQSSSHSDAPPLQSGAPGQRSKNTKEEPTLRYRKKTFLLFLFYAPLVIVPWTLICVLAERPLNASSYFDQSNGLSPDEIHSIRNWVLAIRILNSIGGVVTIPIVSSFLVQAAVIYCQKRKDGQSLSLRQSFALADRGWSDVAILLGAFGKKNAGTGSQFLWLAFLLVLISGIQQPIQSVLVSFDIVNVPTCADLPWSSCDPSHIKLQIGSDPEPGDMARLPQDLVVQGIYRNLKSMSNLDVQSHLWPDPLPGRQALATTNNTLPFWLHEARERNNTFFISALENGTSTGVLRHHAIRLNSSIICTDISRTSFPSPCPGQQPFNVFFRNDHLEVRICVPGTYGVSPWALNRSRQEFAEEIYIDRFFPRSFEFELEPTENTTVHCRASTTRGYFELGNYKNHYTYGPLIDKWPNQDEMANNFNDYLEWSSNSITLPKERAETISPWPISNEQENSADLYGTRDLYTSGPLITSAIALFGNESFFNIASHASYDKDFTASKQICREDILPLNRLNNSITGLPYECANVSDNSKWSERYKSGDRALATTLGAWTQLFIDAEHTEQALETSLFLTNQAILMQTIYSYGGRPILTAPGLFISIPTKTPGATCFISAVIFIQLFGLVYTVHYIYKVPSWTSSLDAAAIARIGKATDDSILPPIGPMEGKDLKRLEEVQGLIGVNGNRDEQAGHSKKELQLLHGSSLVSSIHDIESDLHHGTIFKGDPADIDLGLGAPGVITMGMTWFPGIRETLKVAWKHHCIERISHISRRFSTRWLQR